MSATNIYTTQQTAIYNIILSDFLSSKLAIKGHLRGKIQCRECTISIIHAVLSIC